MENNEQQAPQYYEQPQTTWNNDVPAEDNGSKQATAALVTGILGVLCCGPCAVAALILAIMAKNNGNTSGKATAGLVLGIIGIIFWVIGIIFNLTNPGYLQQMLGY